MSDTTSLTFQFPGVHMADGVAFAAGPSTMTVPTERLAATVAALTSLGFPPTVHAHTPDAGTRDAHTPDAS